MARPGGGIVGVALAIAARSAGIVAGPDISGIPGSIRMPGVVISLPPSEVSEDAQLAAACRRMERGAIEQLVNRFQTDVFGTVLRLLHDRDTALELTNSIFFKVYQNIAAYDPARPLRPWLLRVATNETLNWLRARRRDRESLVTGEAGEQALAVIPGGTDPEHVALAGERADAVRAALLRLPEHYRLVLTLRFYQDLSYQEIAEQTGQDANTVGVQLLRARQMLKRALQGTAGDERAT